MIEVACQYPQKIIFSLCSNECLIPLQPPKIHKINYFIRLSSFAFEVFFIFLVYIICLIHPHVGLYGLYCHKLLFITLLGLACILLCYWAQLMWVDVIKIKLTTPNTPLSSSSSSSSAPASTSSSSFLCFVVVGTFLSKSVNENTVNFVQKYNIWFIRNAPKIHILSCPIRCLIWREEQH